MTKKQIDVQIAVMEKITKEVCKSKETALQFLMGAGIIKKKKMKKKQDMH